MRIAAILVAAGSGTRFGAEQPKQFLTIAGKPVIRHAAEALAAHVTLLQPVGDPTSIDPTLRDILHCLPTVPGGTTRQDSVRAGLEALAPHAPDIVLVHDAAR
ncbi:MAG TPA: 2-C-methyl-D-erythritol 4-phosphate cytidylyltransferase, partial [Rhodopila sp.]